MSAKIIISILKYGFIVIIVGVLVVIALFGAEILLAKRGERLDFHNPPRTPIEMGQGKALTYVVLGDSTAAGEGASSYKTGIAESTARYLALNHQVTYVNLAVSGDRTRDIMAGQVDAAAKFKPDVVLLAIGANDVTHNTSSASVRTSTQEIITKLVAANCNVKIILTGVPEMGAIPRLAQPLRWLVGVKGHSLNKTFNTMIVDDRLTFAPIAAKTGAAFKTNPDLFAADKYHPNDKGYALWIPVIEKALNNTLASQSDHCSE